MNDGKWYMLFVILLFVCAFGSESYKDYNKTQLEIAKYRLEEAKIKASK